MTEKYIYEINGMVSLKYCKIEITKYGNSLMDVRKRILFVVK